MMLFFDHWDQSQRDWQKRWSDLGATDEQIIDPSNFARSGMLSDVVLIVWHQSTHSSRTAELDDASLHNLPCIPYRMFVNSGGIHPAKTTHNGFVHSSSISFPNRASLQHLKQPLRELYTRLADIDRTQQSLSDAAVIRQRHDAWARWEAEARPKGRVVLPALAILCQGYLAAHAEDEAHHAGLREALRQMGWDRLLKERKANLAKRRSETEQASWWAQPFSNTDWPVAINTESNGATLDQVNALVEQFQHSGVTLEVVLAAYRELISVLGGTPWELQRS